MAAETTLPSSPKEKGAGGLDEVEKKIKAFNIDAARTQQQCFEEFQKEVESLKESNPYEGYWKEKLERNSEEVKKMSAGSIDKSYDEAADYIQKLPTEQQAAAADVFSAGADEVAKAAGFVFGKMKELIASVLHKDIGDKVVMAYNDVKRIISKAIEAISSKPSRLGSIQPSTSGSGL